MNAFALAWRNVLRNRRRSIVTMLSVTFGIAAVALFAGYTHGIYNGLGNMAIHGEAIGHLTINKSQWRRKGVLFPNRYLLSTAEIRQIETIVHARLPESHIFPRMKLDGMITNGTSSTIFIAESIDPEALRIVLGPVSNRFEGLHPEKAYGVVIGEELAAILGLAKEDEAILLATTVLGQANAADVEIINTVNTGIASTNDKFIVIPLALARSLKDTGERAEWMTVLVSAPEPEALTPEEGIRRLLMTEPLDEVRTQAIRDQLQYDFALAGLDLEIRTWQEMSMYYRQVKKMYDIIFTLLLGIVLVIVVLSIANSMSMSVVERTREIGTLRAMGYRRSRVIGLFVAESCLLVALGCCLGLGLFFMVAHGINAAKIEYVPPGNSLSVPIYVGFDAWRTWTAILVLGLLGIGTAWFPARRAAKQKIVEALIHN